LAFLWRAKYFFLSLNEWDLRSFGDLDFRFSLNLLTLIKEKAVNKVINSLFTIQ